MIWNTIPNDERLRLWKQLRVDSKDKCLMEQLSSIAKFCSNIPFGARTIDYYNSDSWPTPWEILFYGSFCKSSISVLMFYTLTLLPSEKTIELFLIDDNGDIYLLPVIDNHSILNYHLGEISTYSNICHEFKIIKKYTKEEIPPIT